MGRRLARGGGFGALLALALSFTHSFLVLGAFFALAGLAPLVSGEDRQGKAAPAVDGERGRSGRLRGAVRSCVGDLGLRPLAALRVSMGIQEGLAKAWNRPWRLTVVWTSTTSSSPRAGRWRQWWRCSWCVGPKAGWSGPSGCAGSRWRRWGRSRSSMSRDFYARRRRGCGCFCNRWR
ncbi:MAG: hypothetical protein R2724_08025 [Bryobacterales bacterium]